MKRGLDAEELQAAVEAIVFVSSEPVTRERLVTLFPDEEPAALDAALAALVEAHAASGRGLRVDRVAGGYRIATRPEVHAHVQRFIQREKAERLSLRTLETLSVIAYKQPITAAEVAEIRGVDPSGTLKTLLDKGLIKVVGRKKVVGRPFVYGTTTAFLSAFSLDGLADLPTLREIEEFGPLVAADPDAIEGLDAAEDGSGGPGGGVSPRAPGAGPSADPT